MRLFSSNCERPPAIESLKYFRTIIVNNTFPGNSGTCFCGTFLNVDTVNNKILSNGLEFASDEQFHGLFNSLKSLYHPPPKDHSNAF